MINIFFLSKNLHFWTRGSLFALKIWVTLENFSPF